MFDALKQAHAQTRDRRIADLMSDARSSEFSIQLEDLLFDYSKTNLDDQARDLLVDLAASRDLAARRDAMFTGAKINETEGRAVLHTALRNLTGTPVMVDGVDVMPGVLDTLDRMSAFAEDLRSGAYQGQGGPITDVINIGIGGSDLGPDMVVRALAPYHDGPRCHFVSNVDPADISQTLAQCDPVTTLVIIASKTFTTIETMSNARTAREWLATAVSDPAHQIAALSSAVSKTADWGIAPERVFGFEDWVGGRYSVWGPIGLSVMLAIGPAAFRDMLRGAEAMDIHFRDAAPVDNMPVMHALVGLWHHQVCGYPTRAVLPYDNNLMRFAAYLQQMEMESNGKGVDMAGNPLSSAGPVVWGEPGTNGQHAFYQLIHQGPDIVPCEFLIAAQGHSPELRHQHRLLVANCLAQSEALMRGRSAAEAEAGLAGRFDGDELRRQTAHRVFTGNRPSVTLAYRQLTPRMLGMVIALYEHRVFVEGVILGLNSYDQWGVELGKELALSIQPAIEDPHAPAPAGSTAGILRHLHRLDL